MGKLFGQEERAEIQRFEDITAIRYHPDENKAEVYSEEEGWVEVRPVFDVIMRKNILAITTTDFTFRPRYTDIYWVEPRAVEHNKYMGRLEMVTK
ncbi:MAG: hypothetical protein QW356_04685 [Candidatus Hadarchaeales archaeon]